MKKDYIVKSLLNTVEKHLQNISNEHLIEEINNIKNAYTDTEFHVQELLLNELIFRQRQKTINHELADQLTLLPKETSNSNLNFYEGEQ